MQEHDNSKELWQNEQNADKVSDYPAVLVIYSAIATAALVIFFFNLYVHIWDGAIIYLPLLFIGLYGISLVKSVCCLLLVLLLINLVFPYSIVLYFLFMALSLAAFFIGLFGFILNFGKQ